MLICTNNVINNNELYYSITINDIIYSIIKSYHIINLDFYVFCCFNYFHNFCYSHIKL